MAIHGKDLNNGYRGFQNMQSRHYAAIATVIRERLPHGTDKLAIAAAFADAMRANAGFKRDRFLAACGADGDYPEGEG